MRLRGADVLRCVKADALKQPTPVPAINRFDLPALSDMRGHRTVAAFR